jgi:hypothetical protein
MNVEWCNKTQVVKYLFKYVTESADRVGSEGLLESPPGFGSEEVISRMLSMCTCVFYARFLISYGEFLFFVSFIHL